MDPDHRVITRADCSNVHYNDYKKHYPSYSTIYSNTIACNIIAIGCAKHWEDTIWRTYDSWWKDKNDDDDDDDIALYQ